MKTKVEKRINKVEVFIPKRKYNQPKGAMFVEAGSTMVMKIDDVTVTVNNQKTQNVYVRIK